MMTQLSSYKVRVWRILAISLFTALMSQISLHLFNSNFIASLGVICIPMFIFLLDEINIIPTAVLSAAFVFGLRVLIHFVQYGSLDGVYELYLPESVFYVTAGFLWFLFDQLTNHRRKLAIYIPGIIIIDFICNELELFARMQIGGEEFEFQHLIVIIACIRGLILLMILVFLDQYRILLLSKTHAERYQRLIMLISKLSGEVIWMKKNFDQIEKTMTTSYKLYDSLSAEGNSASAKDALSIAKDIHEIKKEYRLISQGLSESIKKETEDGMEMSELFTILIQSIQNEFSDSGKRLFVVLNHDDRLYTKDPYLFLSVFHNLINNSLDAVKVDTCTVIITEQEGEDDYIYTVSDNGPGVPEEYAERIFEPRFSTKIDYETGTVNRGLGLCIVKDIVEESLGGKIDLSAMGHGAKFFIRIPKKRLERLV